MDPLTMGSLLAAVGGGGGSTKVNVSQSNNSTSLANISSAISNILGSGTAGSAGAVTPTVTSSARAAAEDYSAPTMGSALAGSAGITTGLTSAAKANPTTLILGGAVMVGLFLLYKVMKGGR